MRDDQRSNYRAWPFQEAAQIVKQRRPTGDRPLLFETGFGPSGLPHIGTFAEVARTTWVRRAFEHQTGIPTRLLAFSDDMDGLRKVPLNLPQPELLHRRQKSEERWRIWSKVGGGCAGRRGAVGPAAGRRVGPAAQ